MKAGAKAAAQKARLDEAEGDPEKVHLTTRQPVDSPAAVVRDEARKGYDLLFIGLEEFQDANGNITPEIAELASSFDGPLALFCAPGGKPVARLSPRAHILLPVNGSPASRRAAEICFALARPTGAHVSALFVSQADGRSRTRSREEGVLKEMVELAGRYEVPLSTFISKRGAAAEAILKGGRRGYDMIVMGVNSRTGEELFFGNTATAVFQDWKKPLLFVASEG